jgi:peptidoglycan/LPS O-acetylase OafA/YrhL
LLLLEIRNEGRLDIRAFYIRRILRIWPLFYTAMVIGGLFAWKHPHQIDAYGFILPYSAFVSNWFLMHNPWPDNPVAPLWSISLEEQFYLVLPLAIALAKPKMTRSIGCILITVSLLSLYVQGQHLEAGRVIWCNGLSQTIFFGLGVLLATLPLEQMPPPKKSLRIASFILAFVLFFISAAECYTNFPGNAHSGILIMLGFILAAVSCLLMLYSVWDTASVMPKSLIFLGKISFGLYVFHEIAMETMAWHILPFSHIPPLIRNFLSLPLDIAFAAASYAWLEKPFLRLRTRFTHVANRPL